MTLGPAAALHETFTQDIRGILMLSLTRLAVAACFTLPTLAATATAQQRSSKLDGGWRHVRTSVVAPDTSFVRPTLQGLLVFSGRHFSQVWVIQEGPSVQQASQPSSAEEKAARYDVLIANAGTMDVRDSSATFRYEQAKNPLVVGRSRAGQFRMRSDTLTLVFNDPWEKDQTKSVRTTLTYVRAR